MGDHRGCGRVLKIFARSAECSLTESAPCDQPYRQSAVSGRSTHLRRTVGYAWTPAIDYGDCYESDLRPMSSMSQGVWGVYQAPHSPLVQDLALPREKMPERRKR